MQGLVNLKSWGGGQDDLYEKIAKLGAVDTPFFSAINKYMPSRKAERWKGHSWRYEDMPTGKSSAGFLGGSAPAEAESWGYSNSLNHYEIFKDTYGIEGSMEDAQNVEGKAELARQKTMAAINHRLTIERSLFALDQAPVQEDKANDVAGRMGSLDHWCVTENTIDADDNIMSDTLLRNFAKIGGTDKGMPVTHIYVNDLVKDQIDDLFKAQVRRGAGGKVVEFPNYTEVKNLAYSPNIKIVYSRFVEQGLMFGVNMPSLAFVYQRLTKDEELGRVKDAVEKEIITEATLRVNNPFAVCKMENIKV